MPIQRVLVGYDGTEHSERALQFVVGINDDYETEIHLAFIVNEPAAHLTDQYQQVPMFEIYPVALRG